MVKRLEKLTPYQWIKDETLEIDWDKGIYVSHLLPQRYSHYCKIFNPLFRDKNFTDENVFTSSVTLMLIKLNLVKK